MMTLRSFMPSPRRFPPPWTIEELNNACFVVSYASGQKLGYVYFDDPRSADKPLTRDEARRASATRGALICRKCYSRARQAPRPSLSVGRSTGWSTDAPATNRVMEW